MTDDLVTWLRAQLDNDERVARETTVFDWHRVLKDEAAYDSEGRVETADGQIVIWDHGCRLSAHIGRWNPARVLAEVNAKRRILDECAYEIRDSRRRDTGDGLGLSETVLSLLALPYADRDGYRDEWRP